MAILDDVLVGIMATLKTDLTDAGLVRVRGGLARGVAWAEASGRAADGVWLELRLHHHPVERRLQAGLLSYQPTARGGQVEVKGEQSLSYLYEPAEVSADLAETVIGWLPKLIEEAQASLRNI